MGSQKPDTPLEVRLVSWTEDINVFYTDGGWAPSSANFSNSTSDSDNYWDVNSCFSSTWGRKQLSARLNTILCSEHFLVSWLCRLLPSTFFLPLLSPTSAHWLRVMQHHPMPSRLCFKCYTSCQQLVIMQHQRLFGLVSARSFGV